MIETALQQPVLELVSPSDGMLTPRPYQYNGIDFLSGGKRRMLYDSPGIGKTLQAGIAASQHLPALIVAPSYLTEQWYEFLTTQFPHLTVSFARGAMRSTRLKRLNQGADFTIVNYQMLRTYVMPQTECVVFDESHHVRRYKAAQSRAALAIAKRTPYVFLLTATPVVKEVDDLYWQLKIMDPARFTSYNKFILEYCHLIDTGYEVKVVGARRDKQQSLQQTLDEYALRRTYADVSLQLPDMVETTILEDMPAGLRKAYDHIRDSWRLEEITFANALSAMQALRLATNCEEKVDAVKTLLEDQARGKPAVVYTWYRDSAAALGKALRAPVIDGDMPPIRRRQVALEHSTDTIVATISSLSEGVDLSHARVVVFYEEHFTPGSIHQALSRVRRFRTAGPSLDPVLVYYVMMRDTIDTSIHKLVRRRQASAEEIVRDALQ